MDNATVNVFDPSRDKNPTPSSLSDGMDTKAPNLLPCLFIVP